MEIERLEPGAMMSQAVIHNDTVYLAGQVALDNRDADVAVQTREILGRIDALLAEAGSERASLLSATIWLRRAEDFAAMNAEWGAWLGDEPKPVRATICGVELAMPGWVVEIMVIAARRPAR